LKAFLKNVIDNFARKRRERLTDNTEIRSPLKKQASTKINPQETIGATAATATAPYTPVAAQKEKTPKLRVRSSRL
jgi:hypothetical protein